MLKKQKEFRFAFFDVETSQCTEERGEDGFDFGRHFCTTISLCKVTVERPYRGITLPSQSYCRCVGCARIRPLMSRVDYVEIEWSLFSMKGRMSVRTRLEK